MERLGAALKQAREAQGISLKEIAVRTKISVTALEAVERNDFSRLPGGIFGRSFIRAYAQEIGVDPDATVASFVEELERADREAALRGAVRPEITPDDQRFLERQRRAVMWLRVAVAVGALALLVIGAWQLRLYRQRVAQAPPAESPAAPRLAPPPLSDRPVSTGGVAAVDTATSAGEAPAVVSSTDAPLVVEIAVSADCWISAIRDGGQVVAQLYRSGERVRFGATREILLDVGNAGAATMTINGRPARSLGAPGTKVRLRITPENAAAWMGN